MLKMNNKPDIRFIYAHAKCSSCTQEIASSALEPALNAAPLIVRQAGVVAACPQPSKFRHHCRQCAQPGSQHFRILSSGCIDNAVFASMVFQDPQQVQPLFLVLQATNNVKSKVSAYN